MVWCAILCICMYICHCSWKIMKPLVGISFWLTFWLPLVHFISNILSIALLSSFYCYIHLTIFHVNMMVVNSFWIYCAYTLQLCYSIFTELNMNNKLKMPFMQSFFLFFAFQFICLAFSVILTMKCTAAAAVAFGMQKCGHKQKKKREKKLRRKKTHFLYEKPCDPCWYMCSAFMTFILLFGCLFVRTMADDLECVRLCGISKIHVKV